MVVSQVVYFIADRKEPATRRFGFLCHIVSAFTCCEHLESRAKEVVDPDRAFRSHHLIAEVHPATERPAHLKLADRTILILDQCDSVVFSLDRLDLRVGPAHDFHRENILSNVTAGDFDTMAPQVQDGATACLFQVPEPVAVGPGVCFACLRPTDPAQRAVAYGFYGFDRLGCIHEVLEVPVKNARLLYSFEHAQSLCGIASKRLG